MKRRKPIGTKKRPAVKSEERDEGMDRQTYKVRAPRRTRTGRK